MTRKKVTLAYISCDSARKSTYKKRKKGLLKKIDELSTLCGVEACVVMYSPYEPEPVVWPNREKAKKVVEKFRQLPEMDQHRKMYDHPAYLKQRVNKASQQLARLQRENREREVALAMYGCLAGKRILDGLTLLDLNDLGWMVERTIKEVNLRLEKLRRERNDNTNENNNDENDNLQNDVVAKEPHHQAIVQPGAPDPNPPSLMALPPPPPGFYGFRGEEVGPGLGQFLGLGFGKSTTDMKMQMGPTMWPMGQYYQMALNGFDGASGSGSGYGATAGDNMSAPFGAFFH